MDNKLKILVVDDMPVNLRVVQALIKQMGHHCLAAESGEQALSYFDEGDYPDIVLMDVLMPGMGGFEAARRIRQKVADNWVPIIFLTSLTDEQSLVRGVIEEGGDDYLYKPITMGTLKAKLNSFGRILRLQNEIRHQNKELMSLRLLSEQENEVAAGLMEKIIKSELIEKSKIIQRWSVPTSSFSGDLIVAEQTPMGVWHILLADGTGHGLSAALSVLPMAQPFYSMTRKGFKIGQIALQINRTMHELLPGDRFAGAIIVSLDLVQNSIEIWNGGMPDVYLISPEGGECLHVWRSRHLPLGILDDSSFSTETDYWVYDQDVQIVLCSDGLLEAENKAGDAFGREGLMAVVKEEDAFEQRMEMISDALLTHLDGLPPADDVSLLVIHPRFQEVSTEFSGAEDWMVSDPQNDFSPWEFYLYLTADQLRRIEVVPMVHQILKDIEPPSSRASELFVVLSELLCNAVDHGILGIDSEIKEMEDGMEAFYQERAERLKLLKHGYLGIRLEKILGESGSVLMIRVSCSGQGFDYRAVVAKAKEASMEALFRPYGRGIPLLLRLCESLEYSDQGREALAVFQL